MSVSEKLQKFMDENGYSKADVSRLSGIPYTTIDGIFKKGDENTKLSTLKKLAKLMGCSLDELADNLDQSYFSDPETAKVAQAIYDNPELGYLFDAAKDASPEDLRMATEILQKFKRPRSNACLT